MDESSGRPMAARGAAWRRRQRRLRSMLRHERQTVAMALAESLHHSAQRLEKAKAREVEEQDQHAALRRQKAPPPGMRPGVLQDPLPQGRVGQHSGIGYEPVLALDVPVLQLAEQSVDASSLAFLEEAEEQALEVEYMELVRLGFSKSPASLERMKEVVRRREVLRRKTKKRRKKRTPRTSSSRSTTGRARRRHRHWRVRHAGFAGSSAPRDVFPVTDDWPLLLGNTAGMDQKDSIFVVGMALAYAWLVLLVSLVPL